MRPMAKATYVALMDAGADSETATKAAAETGEIYVNLEATKARLNFMIVLMTVLLGVVAAAVLSMLQIAIRLVDTQ